MEGNRRKGIVIAIVIFVVFDVVAFLLARQLMSGSGEPSRSQWTANSRLEVRESEPLETQSGQAVVAWRLGGGLDAVVVHDILGDEDGSGAWLGTGLGLVRIDGSGHATAYRNYPDAPAEWARDLVTLDSGIALTITLAPGNTGGESVATYHFDPVAAQFEKIGAYSRELAGSGSRLYGIDRRSVVQWERDSQGWMVAPVIPDVTVCSEIDMVLAGDSAGKSRVGPPTFQQRPLWRHPAGAGGRCADMDGRRRSGLGLRPLDRG
jgi:hypothetical protein